MPLSGFFLNHSNADGQPIIAEKYVAMFHAQNMSAGVNQKCIKAVGAGNEHLCVFAQANYQYTDVPIFALNSMLDGWQMGNIVKTNASSSWKCIGGTYEKCNQTQIAKMDEYQTDFRRAISSYSTFKKPGNGAFL